MVPSDRTKSLLSACQYSMLPLDRAEKVLQVVERELLTPYGLRTLNEGDPNYKGRYEGNPYHRDSAYHQGTVWPWLIGPFISAYLKVYGSTEETRQHARGLLKPLEEHFDEGCLGQISGSTTAASLSSSADVSLRHGAWDRSCRSCARKSYGKKFNNRPQF